MDKSLLLKELRKFRRRTQTGKLQLLDELTEALGLDPQVAVEHWLDSGKFSPFQNDEHSDNTSETPGSTALFPKSGLREAVPRKSEKPTRKPYHVNHAPVDLNNPKEREIYEKVVKVLVKKLDNVREADISLKSFLVGDLGADSLDEVEIAMELEKEFSCTISNGALLALYMVEDYVAFLRDVSK